MQAKWNRCIFQLVMETMWSVKIFAFDFILPQMPSRGSDKVPKCVFPPHLLLNCPSTAPLWLPIERGCRGRIGVGATHFPRKSGGWLFGPSTVYFIVWLAEVRNDSDDVISVSMVLVCLSSKPGMCRCWRWPKLFLAELLSVLEWGKPGLRLS